MAHAADMPADAQTDARISRMLVLVLFAAVVSLAGTFSIPPIDRDEARFAQATTQMLETGDYINIRFQDDERNKKPVGIYWLQAASVSLFSDVDAREIWAYRLPSFLAALLSAWLAYLIGCRLFEEETAFFGTLLLIAAPSFSGEATIAKTDATLLATVLASQLALARMYLDGFLAGKRPGLATILLFWAALAIGILIKGPITPMISVLTVAALCLWHFPKSPGDLSRIYKWALTFRPITGLIVLLIIVSPWMIAIGLETQGRFFAEALGTDMLGKVGEAQESHAGPIGYYLIVVWIMFWPAALLLPAGLRHALTDIRHAGVIFCLAWLIPTWAVFEIASTKLPHYTLPVYPALAFLIAHCVTRLSREGVSSTLPVSRLLGAGLYLLVAVLVAVLFIYAGNTYSTNGAGLLEYIFAAVTLVGAVWCVFQLWRLKLKTALVSSSLLGALMAWMLYEGMLARLDAFQVSPRLSAMLEEQQLHPLRSGAEPVALLGYNEPSAIFLLGTSNRISTPQTAADWLKAAPGRLAVVESRQEEAFLFALGDTPVRKQAQLSGYNYSNAIDVVLTLYVSY
ncbi:glycosyltransferase family 39 protein [Parvularcula sp. IMCC14364]|uniref:ArnT family glycosyltransferase n=1 Tax=Parvularcula sp. IMCC14364 TaxID=3067902 RepID=UPI0027421F01|nr:glycosyltransferase family 39 protein [Parvularcula sp. IMCC14364]